jgi:hypothetical protein
VINNTTINRVSYNGGPQGVQARPTSAEVAAFRAPHASPMRAQVQLGRAAAHDRTQFASVNQGRPAMLVAPKLLPADRGIKPAPVMRAVAKTAVPPGSPMQPRSNNATEPRSNSATPAKPGSSMQARPETNNQRPGRETTLATPNRNGENHAVQTRPEAKLAPVRPVEQPRQAVNRPVAKPAPARPVAQPKQAVNRPAAKPQPTVRPTAQVRPESRPAPSRPAPAAKPAPQRAAPQVRAAPQHQPSRPEPKKEDEHPKRG